MDFNVGDYIKMIKREGDIAVGAIGIVKRNAYGGMTDCLSVDFMNHGKGRGVSKKNVILVDSAGNELVPQPTSVGLSSGAALGFKAMADAINSMYGDSMDNAMVAPPIVRPRKCECGCSSVGSDRHSSYCPLYQA